MIAQMSQIVVANLLGASFTALAIRLFRRRCELSVRRVVTSREVNMLACFVERARVARTHAQIFFVGAILSGEIRGLLTIPNL